MIVELHNRVATLTIDRQAKLNAPDYPTIDAILAALDRFETDHSIRAVILTGAGRKAFSAGADIPTLAASIGNGNRHILLDHKRE
jgi:enoyl-CoA hydratase